ncbi:MAG: hypothetical protein L6R41_001098 [Letrouitia leprolyta]|nr:MAG: hypothetical protein L6R41_001098 [Letrouitia leprolyta]
MEIQVAFLEWINTFNLTEDVKSLNELNDGHILWDILRDIDPAYFTSSLPESRANTTKWIPRYENLKFLHGTLVSYISEDRNQVLYAPRAGEGLQVVAQNASAPELIELFKLVLQATIISPRKEEYILKMFSLTPTSQQALKELIENTEASQAPNGQQDDVSVTSSTFVVDPQLELEERLGESMAKNELLIEENQDLKGRVRNLGERMARLQDSYSTLQQLLTDAEDRQQDGSVRSDKDTHTLHDLQTKIEQQENDFADQETRFAQQVRITEALQRKIDNQEASLNSSARKAQDARDELDEVRKERDALAKKANVVDKLKAQLHTSNGKNDFLRKEIEEVQRDSEVSQRHRRENISLTTQVTELKQLVSRIEEDYADVGRLNQQLKLDNENLLKQHKQDQENVAQLRREIRSSSVSSISSRDNENIEGELAELSDTQSKAQERRSNIEKQNRQLESIAQEQAAKIVSLQCLLNEANNQRKPQDIRRSSITSSASAEQSGSGHRFGVPALNGVQAQLAHSLISNDAIHKLRAQLNGEGIKRKEVESKFMKTFQELELAKKDRRSLLSRYMNVEEQHANHLAVSYVAMDKLEMVAQLKEDAFAELKDLQNKHTLLQEKVDRLEAENPEQKGLLMSQAASFQNFSQITQEMRNVITAAKSGKHPEDTIDFVDRYSKEIMQGRKTLVETQKVYTKVVVPVVEDQPSPVASIFSKKSAASSTISWLKRSKNASRPEPQQE